ncbi:hypothetical protein IQ267_17065 [filamentous cyanobacterium LEGE 07170]|nr:hypothetical protein [filamentous cyanobacterium LEGE 07170]
MDKGDLSCPIIPIDILDLSFADHRHGFIPSKGASSRGEGAEGFVATPLFKNDRLLCLVVVA